MKSNHTNEESGPALPRAERDGSKDRSGPFAIRYLEGRCRDLDPDYAGSSLEAAVPKARKLFDELTAALQKLIAQAQADPFMTVGHFVEHVSTARAALAKVEP